MTGATRTPEVSAIIQHAQAGQHLAIHCYAGIGRTGLVAAAVAKRLLGMPGEAAIAWVRRYIPQGVEMPVQRRLLWTKILGRETSTVFGDQSR